MENEHKQHEIDAAQWEKIKDLFPERTSHTMGRPGRDNRQILNGILWILENGASWRELPERYGPWQTVYKRYVKWQTDGLIERVLKEIPPENDETEPLPPQVAGKTACEKSEDRHGDGKATSENPLPCPDGKDAELFAFEAMRPAPEDVLTRAACLLCCALTAKAYASPRKISGTPDAWTAQLVARFERAYRVRKAFTEREWAYLQNPRRKSCESSAHWTEGCAVLLWYLGLATLPGPDEPADVDALNAVLRNGSVPSLLPDMRVRSKEELADFYNLTLRLHTACVLGSGEQPRDTAVNAELVYERHYALNWLLARDGIIAWENVLPTI